MNYEIVDSKAIITWDDSDDANVSYLNIRINYDSNIRVDIGVQQYEIIEFDYNDGVAKVDFSVTNIGVNEQSGPTETISFEMNYELQEDSYESNNTKNDAAIIDFSKKELLTLFPSGDEDWFVLDFDANTIYKFISEGNGAYDADIYFEVYEDTGELAAITNYQNLGYEHYRYDNESDSTYYLRVYCAYPDSSNRNAIGEYYINFETQKIEADSYEENDSSSNAYSISIGSELIANLNTYTDEDYYSFNANEGDQYHFEIEYCTDNNISGVPCRIQILNLAETSGYGYYDDFYWSCPESGTYSMETYLYNLDDSIHLGQYKFKTSTGSYISSISEPNDDSNNAISIDITNEYTGSIHRYDDEDWYVFSAIVGTSYKIESLIEFYGISHPRIEIYYIDGTTLETDNTSYWSNDDYDELDWTCEESGNYYIRITFKNEAVVSNYYIRYQDNNNILKTEYEWAKYE